MTSQFDFSREEWDHITVTPVLVGFAVAKAEDSGFLGSMRETRTIVSQIAEGSTGSPASGLINEAAASNTDHQAKAFRAAGPQELGDAAVLACEGLVSILDQTAEPAIAAGYKTWIISIANAVAEAAKEHGVQVSPAEAILIDRISNALGGAAGPK